MAEGYLGRWRYDAFYECLVLRPLRQIAPVRVDVSLGDFDGAVGVANPTRSGRFVEPDKVSIRIAQGVDQFLVGAITGVYQAKIIVLAIVASAALGFVVVLKPVDSNDIRKQRKVPRCVSGAARSFGLRPHGQQVTVVEIT